MTKKTDDKNLPAVTEGQTFDLTTLGAIATNVPAEFVAEVDDSDFGGYEQSRNMLPIVDIRQKEKKNERGKIEVEAGGFKIYDALSKEAGVEISDVSGEAGLTVTIVGDRKSRVYFRDGQPVCRSRDGEVGEGDPGGACNSCPHSKAVGDKPTACRHHINLLCFDHHMKAPYILRFTGSGFSPYDRFKARVDRLYKRVVPMIALPVNVTTKFVQHPKGDHYVPVFQVVGEPNVELMKQMRGLRGEMDDSLAKTVAVNTEEGEHHTLNTADPGGEVPPGVDPVETAETAQHDDGLPF